MLNVFPDVFQDLLGAPQLEQGASFESLNEDEAAAVAGTSRHYSPDGARVAKPPPLEKSYRRRSPSPTRTLPTVPSATLDDLDTGRNVRMKNSPPKNRSVSHFIVMLLYLN